jgi:cytosine/adenosine deaminase-related metal-dependent hydrolase
MLDLQRDALAKAGCDRILTDTMSGAAADRPGSLAAGRQADISVLELREGDWMVYDVLGTGLRATRAVVPFLTVRRGRVFMPDWGPRPRGWEPDHVLPAAAPTGERQC